MMDKEDDELVLEGVGDSHGVSKSRTVSASGVKALDHHTATTIRQGQILTKTSDIVRELVENSVDADATSVQVFLTNFGLDKLEVRDNGHGIVPGEVQLACKGGHTSKLKDTSNLSRSEWFGFRGEALNALCATGTVTLCTKTTMDNRGTKYVLDGRGYIKSDSDISHGLGTTVTVEKLFEKLPVRRQWHQNSKTAAGELKNIETFLQALAIGNPKCHISFYHNNNLLWTKASVQTMDQALIAVLGHNISKKMGKCGPLNLDLGSSEDQMNDVNGTNRVLELYLPKKPVDMRTMSFTSNKLSMIFCNRKRVYIREYEKLVHRYVTAVVEKPQPADKRRYPVSVLSITVPPKEVDFNRDLDKTKVFLVHKDLIYQSIEEALMKFYEIDLKNTEMVDDGKSEKQQTNSDLTGNKTDPPLVSNILSTTGTPILDSAPLARGNRANCITEFLQDIPSKSTAFSNSPAKLNSEPTAVVFPPCKPSVEVSNATSRNNEITPARGEQSPKEMDPVDDTTKRFPVLVSNFEITVQSQLSPPDNLEAPPLQKTIQEGIPPHKSSVTALVPGQLTDKWAFTRDDWATGRIRDANGEIIQNVAINPCPTTPEKNAEMERFQRALFAGTSKSPFTTPYRSPQTLTTSPLHAEPPTKRIRSDILSPIRSPVPTSLFTQVGASPKPRLPQPNTPTSSKHRQVTLDSFSKWPTPKRVFSQAASNAIVGVRLPMTPIFRDFPKHSTSTTSTGSRTPTQLEHQFKQPSIRNSCVPLPHQTPNQNQLSNQLTSASSVTPIQQHQEQNSTSYKLTPKVNGSIRFQSSLGPLYVAQTSDGIGIFSPVNLIKYFPSESGCSQDKLEPDFTNAPADMISFSDNEVDDLFKLFISHPKISGAPEASKIFHIMKTQSALSHLYGSMSSYTNTNANLSC